MSRPMIRPMIRKFSVVLLKVLERPCNSRENRDNRRQARQAQLLDGTPPQKLPSITPNNSVGDYAN